MIERETERTIEPIQPDVHRETAADVVSAPVADVTSRDIYQERVSGPAGEQVVRSERVNMPSDATRRGSAVTRIKQIIYFIFGVITALLAIRFALLLLGANAVSPFVNLIYEISNIFVQPFHGIFAQPALGGPVFEWAALVGIVVYSLVAYGLARIVELIFAPAESTITRAQ